MFSNMVKSKLAIALLLASLILLVVYGADVIIAAASSSHPIGGSTIGRSARGFLPFNEAIRGSVFGGGAVIMSILGFVIGKKEPSITVSALLFINGGLIIAGMMTLIAQGVLSSGNASGAVRTIGSTIAMGAVLLGLGFWKTMSDRKIVMMYKR